MLALDDLVCIHTGHVKQDWTAADLGECLWFSQNMGAWEAYKVFPNGLPTCPYIYQGGCHKTVSDEVWGFLTCLHALLRVQLQSIKLLSCSMMLASQPKGVPSFVWWSSGLLSFSIAMSKWPQELALWILFLRLPMLVVNYLNLKKGCCFFSGQIC